MVVTTAILGATAVVNAATISYDNSLSYGGSFASGKAWTSSDVAMYLKARSMLYRDGVLQDINEAAIASGTYIEAPTQSSFPLYGSYWEFESAGEHWAGTSGHYFSTPTTGWCYR